MPVQISPQQASLLPMESFLLSGLHPSLVKNLAAMGFSSPTEIQGTVVPAVLTGQDTMMVADNPLHLATAALISIMHKLLTTTELRDKNKLACVIVTNTAEQAEELLGIAFDLSRGTDISFGNFEAGEFKMKGFGATILVIPIWSFIPIPMTLFCRMLMTKMESYWTSCKFLVMIDQEENDLRRATRELFWDKEIRQTIVIGRCLSDDIQEELQDFLRKDYLFISASNFSGAEKDKGEDAYEEEGYEEEEYEEVVHEEEVYEEVYEEEVYETLEHTKVYNNNEAQDRNRHVVEEKECQNCEMQKINSIVDMVGVGKMLTEFSDTIWTIKKDMLTIKTGMEVMTSNVEHLKEELKVMKVEIKAIKEEVFDFKQESNEGKQKELFKKDISKLKEDMEDMKEVAETAMLIGSEVIKIKQMLQDLSLP